MENTKRLPSEWEIITGITIRDPDGWDRKNYDESWGTPIDFDEWEQRMMRSTVDLRGPHVLRKVPAGQERPAERIPEVIALLQKAWEENPNQRLTQLIYNVLRAKGSLFMEESDLYNVEDRTIFKALQAELGTKDEPWA